MLNETRRLSPHGFRMQVLDFLKKNDIALDPDDLELRRDPNFGIYFSLPPLTRALFDVYDELGETGEVPDGAGQLAWLKAKRLAQGTPLNALDNEVSFVIAYFDLVSREVPLEHYFNIDDEPPSNRWQSVPLTETELAAVYVLVFGLNKDTVSADDRRDGTPPARLLQRVAEMFRKRRRSEGWAHNEHPHASPEETKQRVRAGVDKRKDGPKPALPWPSNRALTWAGLKR